MTHKTQRIEPSFSQMTRRLELSFTNMSHKIKPFRKNDSKNWFSEKYQSK